MDKTEGDRREGVPYQTWSSSENRELVNHRREYEIKRVGRPPSEVAHLSDAQLRAYVTTKARELQGVIEGSSTREITLCVTVLRRLKDRRDERVTLLTSSAESYGSRKHLKKEGRLKDIGPYLRHMKGTKNRYWVIDQEGNKEPYAIGGTDHHAEQRAIRYAEKNGYEILAMAPTRPCCDGCRAVLEKRKLLNLVPENLHGRKSGEEYGKSRIGTDE